MIARTAAFLLLLGLVCGACTGAGYRPPPGDLSGPVHGESGGGGGSGGGM